MDNIEKELLTTISGADHFEGAYNIRKHCNKRRCIRN